jgi:hypothetical protein
VKVERSDRAGLLDPTGLANGRAVHARLHGSSPPPIRYAPGQRLCRQLQVPLIMFQLSGNDGMRMMRLVRH